MTELEIQAVIFCGVKSIYVQVRKAILVAEEQADISTGNAGWTDQISANITLVKDQKKGTKTWLKGE